MSLDFMTVAMRNGKKATEIYPKFIVGPSSDLMIRGSDFYAIWNEETNLWSTKELDALNLIDKELDAAREKYLKDHPEVEKGKVEVLHMWDSDTGMIDKWHRYCWKQSRDNYKPLDDKIIFSNTETCKTDYATRKLSYPIDDGNTEAYDALIGTLYSPTERHKLEWAIGSVIAGDSKKIQKFIVMYGSGGTGKSTVLHIIEDLFDGYYSNFDSKALGSATNVFALEAFKNNPLVAIQHDGDLSKIEDNTRLNSLVSHEQMIVNEKFKSTYSVQFNSFLFMGTNKPVRITDSRSGIIRRLIDVSPTGSKIPRKTYDSLVSKIKFELPGIAYHCLQVYNEDPLFYENYIPTSMIGASNDFYNFVLDSYDIFKRDDSTTLKAAYELYKNYCDDARVPYPYSMRVFKEELKSYFKEFEERSTLEDGSGTRARNVYKKFISDKFSNVIEPMNEKTETDDEDLLNKFGFTCTVSLFDDICKDYAAQYASDSGTPLMKWSDVNTKLSDIDTTKLHYVMLPENHIVIDFDLKDENGKKSFKLNSEAASHWPRTYAELSKSGQGIHLHYIYEGDATKLSRVFDESIEVKVFTGNSSLRRKLSLCNDIPIARISSGLPIKESKKVDFDGFKNEKALRTYIKRNLKKQYVAYTKPSIDFIYNALEQAYESGIEYDVSDMAAAIISFAGRSHNNADYCMKMTNRMKFKSKEINEETGEYVSDTIVIFDVEVFPNLIVVVYKALGKNPVILINPTPGQIGELIKFKLIGFNNRDYDNHILYALLLGESIPDIFKRSQAIIHNNRDAKISKAYGISYTDIYDFCSKKQSLKKWEIELGVHHQELGLPWDKPVPEDKWDLVAQYCVNDVVATEAVFEARKSDFLAREILADISGGTVNDTTNSLSTKLIFGANKKPQGTFRYRNLAEPVMSLDEDMENFLRKNFPEMMAEPHGEAKSLLPYFPGYTFNKYKSKDEKSKYKGCSVGEGGYVWAKPGMYSNVITFDVSSMHPHSATSEYLFGEYTKVFNDLLEARIAIKHKNYDEARKMFNGKLAPYLTEDSDPKMLSNALKIVINSVYGLTAARFENPFRDPRNVDNIVAKRGALFMVDLMDAVTKLGGNVIHIKTDSIKVENPTPELQNYILEFGKRYGYTFEIEHKFEKICLVNDAVYIAKCAADDPDQPGQWTATGTQFAVPYVFKTLFSKEPIIFEDYCETKSVSGEAAIYIDKNEGFDDGTHNYQFIGKVGLFTPVIEGCGSGELFRIDGDKIGAVSGTKGFRWLESTEVQEKGLESWIDKSYYTKMVDEAVKDISVYGDFEWFSS